MLYIGLHFIDWLLSKFTASPKSKGMYIQHVFAIFVRD